MIFRYTRQFEKIAQKELDNNKYERESQKD